MGVLKWILSNWDSIIVVIAMITITIVLVKRGETAILKQILFNLVTKAEQEYGDGTGTLKYAAVADWLYQRIPNILKILFTSKDIEKMIEAALSAAKQKWSTNPNIKEFTICPTDKTEIVHISNSTTEPAAPIHVSHQAETPAVTELTIEEKLEAEGEGNPDNVPQG